MLSLRSISNNIFIYPHGSESLDGTLDYKLLDRAAPGDPQVPSQAQINNKSCSIGGVAIGRPYGEQWEFLPFADSFIDLIGTRATLNVFNVPAPKTAHPDAQSSMPILTYAWAMRLLPIPTGSYLYSANPSGEPLVRTTFRTMISR
ncbi:hypothetical protein H109_01785 [Trichophyton interdigitale MR816]|uniref:Uncharacterized protein n=1 Tax=Trichophyton interdigitale (strain MR816) TaxID=1215338 RepID=A0A059JFE1_TRIIM|nr:hypothetical protein H109_01785 [Trichophyton interdigitale MR816]